MENNILEEIKNSKIYNDLINSLDEHIETKIKDVNFDKTYDGVILGHGTVKGLKVNINGVDYDNVDCGNFTFNRGDSVKVTIPQNNFNLAYVVGTRNSYVKPEEPIEYYDIDKVYPVGSIFLSVSPTNPYYYFGGSWSLWGQGKFLLGICDSDYYNDNTNYVYTRYPEASGGSWVHSHDAISGSTYLSVDQLPSHYHEITDHAHSISGRSVNLTVTQHFATGSAYGVSSAGSNSQTNTGLASFSSFTSGGISHQPGNYTTYSGSTGSGYGHSHDVYIGEKRQAQPYISCFMWKRTS